MTLVQVSAPNARSSKLAKLFKAVLGGEQRVANSNVAKQFLQAAATICETKTAVHCVEEMIASSHGLDALKSSVRADLELLFLKSATLPFLSHLSDPAVETLNNGRFLFLIISALLIPITLWSTILDFYNDGKLLGKDAEAFAWLCLQVMSAQQPGLEQHQSDVKQLMKDSRLLKSTNENVRSIAYRIEKIIQIFSSGAVPTVGISPGGRHDNDFADFRQISIYPTADEFRAKEEPFLQRATDVFDAPLETRTQSYRDWLFRLLREDMLADLREDLQVALGQKKRQGRQPVILSQFRYVSVNKQSRIMQPHVLQLSCASGINVPKNLKPGQRERFAKESKSIVKDKSFGALSLESSVIAFGSVVRDDSLLLRSPPVIGIKFTDSEAFKKATTALQSPGSEGLQFIVVDTATFAYQPILQRLKEIGELPLEQLLLDPTQNAEPLQNPPKLDSFLKRLRQAKSSKASIEVSTGHSSTRKVEIRDEQLDSLLNGLSRQVALIQGPPGTGKSFIGALILQALFKQTKLRMLVLSYTNHALDQFVRDLINIGIPDNEIVRLGGQKCSSDVEQCRLDTYGRQSIYWLNMNEKSILKSRRSMLEDVKSDLQSIAARLQNTDASYNEILEHLEFSEGSLRYWLAFQPPQRMDDFEMVGSQNQNRGITATEIFRSWLQNRHSAATKELISSLNQDSRCVWELPIELRRRLRTQWTREIHEEHVAELARLHDRASELQAEIYSMYDEEKRKFLKDKRIIACTTTGAAMYQSIIKTAGVDVVMVEEAGEVPEAHVITAQSPSVQRLILIGDHKQLPPKISNYNLTREKGDGFDLNVSLFERLILKDHPYTTLQVQHRSHPDISTYARMLAYKELRDDPKTSKRSEMRGIRRRVVFVHHEHPEKEQGNIGDRRDPGTKGSKQNEFEAKMVLKTVKYLGQQGYKSEHMVVLTPYLGQLSLLRDTLRQENDPVLNDLDSHELMRAGVISEAASKVKKRPLRLSTIGEFFNAQITRVVLNLLDNYQGEESDIVVASLTRSNERGDIGFMKAQERLVVLMSRAKSAMILFGNMLTFMKSKSGADLWRRYFDALKGRDCLFDGVPVRCEQHNAKNALLKNPEDFDRFCPDGGCTERWHVFPS